VVCTIYKSKRRNGQIFGGTQKYFGGTSRFRGTLVEKHCYRGTHTGSQVVRRKLLKLSKIEKCTFTLIFQGFALKTFLHNLI
jgi:hypothetical protein